jgi:hypothetical protein
MILPFETGMEHAAAIQRAQIESDLRKVTGWPYTALPATGESQ